MRLVGSLTNGEGAVEVYTTDLAWVSVCPDSNRWTDGAANAVCLQLGYENGEAKTFTYAVTTSHNVFSIHACHFMLSPSLMR